MTMPAEDYLSMLDLFAYGRFVRQQLGSGPWLKFRKSVAAKVAAHGLKAGRVYQPLSRRRGHEATVAPREDRHTVAIKQPPAGMPSQ
jgi:hypothetical protein